MNRKDYVSLEVAQSLYEVLLFDTKTNIALKDFNLAYKKIKKEDITIYCKYGYTIPCPLLYEVQKWLREEYKIAVCPNPYSFHWDYTIFDLSKIEDDDIHKILGSRVCWDSYEEALNEGIKEALKLI